MYIAMHFITRTTLSSAGISCRRVSVCHSVTSRCSTETAKRRITQTVPHDSPGTLVSWRWKSQQNSNGGHFQRRRQMQVGWDKCRCSSWKLSTFYAKRCHLGSVASLSHWACTLGLFVCSTFAVMQRVARVCQRQLILVVYKGLMYI